MKSREPRSTFKKSWGTLRDNISYRNDFFSLDFPASISTSPLTTSSTPSSTTQSAESLTSGLDSLIIRREKSFVRNQESENKNNVKSKQRNLKDLNGNEEDKQETTVNHTKLSEYTAQKREENCNIIAKVRTNKNKSKTTSGGAKYKKNNKSTEKAPILQAKTQTRILNGFVGFSSIGRQISRKQIHKGFKLNLLVIGEPGLGKSTLINSLFKTNIYGNERLQIHKNGRVEKRQAILNEDGVRLDLSIIDIPGYGGKLDNTGCWDPAVEYIEEQLDKFYEEENRAGKMDLSDTRVHACLHFLAPTGHGIKKLDLEVMRRLHDKVNIIPLIGKADSFNREEVSVFKQKIRHQLKQHKILTYCPPYSKSCLKPPLAVIGANTSKSCPGGKILRLRRYPWGGINIEDKEVCDFTLLHSLLISECFDDLIDATKNIIYENYRSKKLSVVAALDEDKLNIPNKNPLAILEDEANQHKRRIKLMEQEMMDVFEKKIDEKLENMRKITEENIKEIDDAQKLVEKDKEALALRRNSFERQKTLLDSVVLPSPSHSTTSAVSTSSTEKKKRFRFSLGSFKFKT